MAKLIVKTGQEVEARDHALFFDGIFRGNGVMHRGNELELTTQTANLIKIKDGIVVVQGWPYIIYPGEVIDVSIDNGTQNMKRNDIVVAEFTNVDGVQTMTIKAIKGTPNETTAADPVLTQQDTLDAGTTYQLPLYRIRLNGINIEGTDDLRTFVNNLNSAPQVVDVTDEYVEMEINFDE